MIALDTNVLVRLFVADDAAQTARVVRLLADAPAVYVSKTVVLELVWVLSAVYEVRRDGILRALATLAGLEKVELEDRPNVERAITLFEKGLEDFADALHVCSSGGASELATFDKKLVARARKLDVPVRVRAP